MPHSCPKRARSALSQPRGPRSPGRPRSSVHQALRTFTRRNEEPSAHPFKVVARVRIPLGASRIPWCGRKGLTAQVVRARMSLAFPACVHPCVHAHRDSHLAARPLAQRVVALALPEALLDGLPRPVESLCDLRRGRALRTSRLDPACSPASRPLASPQASRGSRVARCSTGHGTIQRARPLALRGRRTRAARSTGVSPTSVLRR